MGPPKFLPSLYSRATTPNPDGPSEFKPIELFVLDSAFLTASPTAFSNNVANMSSGGVIRPVAHEFLCVRFNPFVRSRSCSSGTATLDTGGWLGLARQGLSPCKLTTSFLGALGICF
jgi:hypothetical protein